MQAGTLVGRDIGRIVGGNLARYTAELGGKVHDDVTNDRYLTTGLRHL